MESKLEKLLTNVGAWLGSGEAERTPHCLDDNAVAGYIADSLPQEDQEKAEEHLGNCRYCFQHVVEIQNLLTMRELGRLGLEEEKEAVAAPVPPLRPAFDIPILIQQAGWQIVRLGQRVCDLLMPFHPAPPQPVAATVTDKQEQTEEPPPMEDCGSVEGVKVEAGAYFNGMTVTLYLTLRDETTGDPLEGIPVQFTVEGEAQAEEGKTDAHGRVSFACYPEDQGRLSIGQPGNP